MLGLIVGVAQGCLNNCNRRGRCVAGICQCNVGWVGDDCSIFDQAIESGMVVADQAVGTRQWKFYHLFVPSTSTIITNYVQTR